MSRLWDETFGDPPGAAFYEICYISDLGPWVNAFGETVPIGEASFLPYKCGGMLNGQEIVAPCIESRTKEAKSRNIKIDVLLDDLKMR